MNPSHCHARRGPGHTYQHRQWTASAVVAAALWALPCFAAAADGPGIDIQRRQATRMEQTQTRLGADVERMQSGPSAGDPSQVVIDETPCFKLNTIQWEDAGEFPWINRVAAGFAGQCLGAHSLKRLREYLSLHLLERGYINSRVIYPEQNLAAGTLLIQVIAGRVSDVVDVGNPIGHRWFALATSAGQRVNQRDLDQTLENLRRLPSQADVRIDLLPGKALGETELHIHHGTGPRYQGNVTLDNAGARNTGKNQLSANLDLDSPLGLNDALSLYYNTNADRGNPSQGSRASGLQWSLPLGYASFFLGVNGSGYQLTTPGYAAPIIYTGKTRALEAGWGLTTYRAGAYKGQTQIKLLRKVSRNAIDGSDIAVQARDAVGAELSHTHKHTLGAWTTSLGWAYRFSLPSWSKNQGILVGDPDWSGHYHLHTLSLSAARQAHWVGQAWQLQSQLRWQKGGSQLPPFEYTAIGGRYSVRGFNGEHTLSAESGGYWRNEASLALFNAHELYLALDAGRVAGPQTRTLTQKTLAGAAIGLRGRLWRTRYDLSLGQTLRQPDTFPASSPVFAASVTVEFNP